MTILLFFVLNWITSGIRKLIQLIMILIMKIMNTLEMKKSGLFKILHFSPKFLGFRLILIRLVFLFRKSILRRCRCRVIQVNFVMKDYWIKKVLWIANHITFYLTFIIIFGILVINFIHRLIMMFLCSSSFIYYNSLFF